MNYRLLRWTTAIAILTVLVIPAQLATAQSPPLYVVVDPGTLGGPGSYPNTNGHTLTNSGVLSFSPDTPAINPNSQTCSGQTDCHVTDAATWQNGVMTDYGTLGGYGAGLFEVNGRGTGVGFGETGVIDPQTNFPEAHAAITDGGHLADLGTLGGNESWATSINSRGEVAGAATNTIPDPYALNLMPYPSATQWHAVLWQSGVPHDLGTLGGPDSLGFFLNERGQMAGVSFTSSTPNGVTGAPPMDPFLWQDGAMRDLGNLGGASTIVNWMNSRGEVVGQSDLAGDETHHPFLWDGTKLLDLGTLGGAKGTAYWVNDAGQVVGAADLPGSPRHHHAFLWENGMMADLPPAPGALCSNAYVINAAGQAVGSSADCHGHQLAAMLWENGQAIDLNTVVAPSPFHLSESIYINDRGEIAAFGQLSNGDIHVVVLEPQARATAAQGLPHASGAGGSSASSTTRVR